ncbi:hypothetical protein NOVOSPHI9U_420224 [Novosphingobium sp. 9U]|nr:hypothetical protein NOVOSPHI9U_420224 [Novosphingobium sp. 9U]
MRTMATLLVGAAYPAASARIGKPTGDCERPKPPARTKENQDEPISRGTMGNGQRRPAGTARNTGPSGDGAGGGARLLAREDRPRCP